MTASPAIPLPPSDSGVAATRWLATGSLLALIVLCLAWELVLAPVRPGGSWLAIKALPLCIPLAGILKNRMYTYRWVSLVIWLYFTEGVVRGWATSPHRNGWPGAKWPCASCCSPPARCMCACASATPRQPPLRQKPALRHPPPDAHVAALRYPINPLNPSLHP